MISRLQQVLRWRPSKGAADNAAPQPEPARPRVSLPARPWYDDESILVPPPECVEAAGGVGPEDTERLQSWRRDGFVQLKGAVPEERIDALVADVDRRWTEEGSGLWVEHYNPEQVLISPAQPEFREQPHKVLDVHAKSAAAQAVLASPELARWLHLCLGPQVLAFQSLVFDRGTQQTLHRDTNYVGVDPRWQMIAVWIALEDIQPNSGELEYYVGSHKLRDYVFSNGTPYYDPATPLPDDYSEHYHSLAAQHGMERQRFLPKKGDVLFWHGGLAHGGSSPVQPGLSRHSFVAHFCPLHATPDYARKSEWGPHSRITPGLSVSSPWRSPLDGPFCTIGPL